MNPSDEPQIAAILNSCRTLSDATTRLESLVPSKAERWGLWDGYADREHSLAGLPMTGAVDGDGQPLKAFDEFGQPVSVQVCDSQAEREYNDGRAAGFVMKQRKVAA